ncbi:MAG: two-CW domain-containing protein [Actinomycetota bacterium]
MNCWEFKKCGRDKTNDCPAYPNHGHECWRVAGTMCGGEVQGTFAKKLASCMECDFYKMMKGIAVDKKGIAANS